MVVSSSFRSPDPDAFTQEFWDACAAGRFLVRRCHDCHRAHFYPRRFCPMCWSTDGEWEQASGRATLYTWSIVHQNDLQPFRDLVPYVVAIVTLEEGPRVMTRLVDSDPTVLAVDLPLEVVFVEDDGITVPCFSHTDIPAT